MTYRNSGSEKKIRILADCFCKFLKALMSKAFKPSKFSASLRETVRLTCAETVSSGLSCGGVGRQEEELQPALRVLDEALDRASFVDEIPIDDEKDRGCGANEHALEKGDENGVVDGSLVRHEAHLASGTDGREQTQGIAYQAMRCRHRESPRESRRLFG